MEVGEYRRLDEHRVATLRRPLTAVGQWAGEHLEDVLRAREDYDPHTD